MGNIIWTGGWWGNQLTVTRLDMARIRIEKKPLIGPPRSVDASLFAIEQAIENAGEWVSTDGTIHLSAAQVEQISSAFYR